LLYFGKDGTIEGGTLLCYGLFFDDFVIDDPSHIIFIIEVDWRSVFLSSKSVLTAAAYPRSVAVLWSYFVYIAMILW
jgi:hypothetical protein